jgi:cytochrome c5
MKKIAVIFSLVAGSFILVKCTPKASKTIAETPKATTTDVAAAPPSPATPPAAITPAAAAAYTAQQIESGKMIYNNNCGKCHALYSPEKYDQAHWVKILNAMVPKAKLNETDGNLARAYVFANAKQG